MEDNMQVDALTLILHAGNAKSSIMEAIEFSNEGNDEMVDEKLKEANEELSLAHQMQTDLLTKMANGEDVPVDILMVHAQDHLSNAILINDLAKQLIYMQKEIRELKGKIHE